MRAAIVTNSSTADGFRGLYLFIKMVMENRLVDPGQHPGESPTYILHKGFIKS